MIPPFLADGQSKPHRNLCLIARTRTLKGCRFWSGRVLQPLSPKPRLETSLQAFIKTFRFHIIPKQVLAGYTTNPCHAHRKPELTLGIGLRLRRRGSGLCARAPEIGLQILACGSQSFGLGRFRAPWLPGFGLGLWPGPGLCLWERDFEACAMRSPCRVPNVFAVEKLFIRCPCLLCCAAAGAQAR